MSLVSKKTFLEAVTTSYEEFERDLHNSLAKRKLLIAVKEGVRSTKDELVRRANNWLLPHVPERKFLRDIHKTLWFHVYSDKYGHKFHNTIQHEKGEFIREIRFKLRGTKNL